MKVLFLFIDGVGLRQPAPDNPVNPENCPTLCSMIENESVPIDACLDVQGLPQSATGQATMFTGVNASLYMGRHCEGFPGPSLRKLIEEDNLMMELSRKGIRCRFADAYMIDRVDDLRVRRFKSVTTVMALTQPNVISTQDDLMENFAVTHDITRAQLRGKGHNLKLISPTEAAGHLIQIARAYDFTLFEFFQTDLSGHSRNYQQACDTLKMLDEFLAGICKFRENSDILLVLTSDHGNIEDMGTRGHTRNQVPLVAIGPGADGMKRNANSLLDITPRILRLLVPGHIPAPRVVKPISQ